MSEDPQSVEIPLEGAEKSAAPGEKPGEKTKLSGGGILVSSRQKGNPILKFVRNVPWEFTDSIIPGEEPTAWTVTIRNCNMSGFLILFNCGPL